MSIVTFDCTPDAHELGLRFPESPYFSAASIAYRESAEHGVYTIIVRVWADIAWALTYSIPPDNHKLKIWLVEVHSEYIGRGLWTKLLLEAEELNRQKIYGCFWYLNSVNNIFSKNMFLRAGYKQFDSWKFFK